MPICGLSLRQGKAGDKKCWISPPPAVWETSSPYRLPGAETDAGPIPRNAMRGMGVEHVTRFAQRQSSPSRSARYRRRYGVNIVLNSLTGAANVRRAGICWPSARTLRRNRQGDVCWHRLGIPVPSRTDSTFCRTRACRSPSPMVVVAICVQAHRERSADAPQCTHYPLAEAARRHQLVTPAHRLRSLLDTYRVTAVSVAVAEQKNTAGTDGSHHLGGLSCSSPRSWPRQACGRIVRPHVPAQQSAADHRRPARLWWSVSPSRHGGPAGESAATATRLHFARCAAAVVKERCHLSTDELHRRDWSPCSRIWNAHRATLGQPLRTGFCALHSPSGARHYSARQSRRYPRPRYGSADFVFARSAAPRSGQHDYVSAWERRPRHGAESQSPEEGAYAFETARTPHCPAGAFHSRAPWLADLVRHSPWDENVRIHWAAVREAKQIPWAPFAAAR